MAAPIGEVACRFLCTKLVQISTTRTTLTNLRWPIGRCNYHGSSCLYKSGRSLRRLEKMLTKKKKKFYYDPMNVAQLGKLATGFSSSNKTKMKSEDSIRLRTYNTILYDNINEMMTTSLISEELEELQITVLGVRVSGDMSACRVYWRSTGVVKDDDRIEKILNRHKGPLRRALISHRVLGKIPPIFFLKDKASASIAEIERLLAIADFGPDDEDADTKDLSTSDGIEESEMDGRIKFMQRTDRTSQGDVGGVVQPSLFGIDHDALNRMISANRNVDYGAAGTGLDDGNLDKRFEQFRGFMKKRKLGKAERKEAAYYKGELETYRSSRSREVKDFVEEETMTDKDESYYDDDYDENTQESEFQERSDDFTDEPTKNK